jgi:hypothetical protein
MTAWRKQREPALYWILMCARHLLEADSGYRKGAKVVSAVPFPIACN